MATKNVINEKSQDLTIDPGSGDSFIQFDINATGEFRIGVDDDASDAFVISQGSALGTNNTLSISAIGEITKPLQPAFLASVNNFIDNQTGDGTVYTMVYATEIFDQNSDFDGTSTFTAPITGKYRLKGSVWFDEVGAGNTSGYVQIVTSNRTYRSLVCNYGVGRVAANGQISWGFTTVLCDMDVTDTAIVQVMISGGAKIVDIGYNNRGIFCGELVA